MFDRGTVLDLQLAFSTLVLDSAASRRKVLTQQTRCAPLQAYVDACASVSADDLAQGALVAATRVWLGYTQAAEQVRRPGAGLEPSEENAVSLTFSVGDDGELTWHTAAMTGLPKDLRSRLAETPLSDLPFVARSVGRGGAGIVVAQDLGGLIEDKSAPYAKATLERIARKATGVPSASANEGLWVIADRLKASSVNGLGLALEGA